MCQYAKDDSKLVVSLSGIPLKEIRGICLLKKESVSKQLELCDYLARTGEGGSVVSDVCPFYVCKRFSRCKYSI